MESGKRLFKILSGAALIGLPAFSPTAFSQQVVAPMNTPTPVAEKQAATTSESASSSSPGTTSSAATTTTPSGFRLGPFLLRPHAAYRYLYGDGLSSAEGDRKKTSIQSFSPGVYAELGTHLNFDFTATWNYYSSRAFRDTVDETAFVNWTTQYQEWSLSAGHTYSRTDSPTIETGRQTQQTSHTSTFDALYAMGSRYALETTLGQNLRFADGFNDPMEWTVREMLHQKTTPQIDSAIGVQYGYTAIEKTADIGALQLLASLSWRPLKQLNMSLQGGVEKRHIYSDPATDNTSPVYRGSIQFIPTTTTQIGVTASRSTSASFLDNQLTESTEYGISFNQRLLKRFQFASSYSHQESEYSSTLPGFVTDRKDKTDSINLSLSTAFFSRLRTSIAYQYTNNSSNSSGFKFSSSQIGFEISYSF